MNRESLILLFLLLTILAIRIFGFYTLRPVYRDGENIGFESTVASEPKFYGDFQNFSLSLPNGQIVFITTEGYPEYTYGQKVGVFGNLKYKLLNDNKTRIMTMSYPEINLVKNHSIINLAVVNLIRQKLINVFQNSLDKDSSSLLLGIVFGIKEDMSKDFRKTLRLPGLCMLLPLPE